MCRVSKRTAPRSTGAALIASAALLVAATGCRSTPVNSNPACTPCSRFLPLASPPTCPATPETDATLAGGRSLPAIHQLVLEGGGVKGIAYPGALGVLDDQHLLDGVDRVAGTSAGALTALLVALGYTPAEIRSLVLNLSFESFEDGGPTVLGDLARLHADYGLFRGDFALCVLECAVEHKLGDRKATFADLHERVARQEDGYRDLYVIGTDLDLGSSRVFSHEKSADVPLADASRISMSLPLFFAARLFESNVFVDGGVLRNYAIDLFDPPDGPSPTTLGLALGGEPPRRSIDDLGEDVSALFGALLNDQTDRLCRTPADVERSIFIPTLGIKTADFGLSLEQKCALIRSGTEATREYLARTTPQRRCPDEILELLPARERYPRPPG